MDTSFYLRKILTLIYPIIPQITSFILEEKGIDLQSEEFPKPKNISSELSLIEDIMNFNSFVWKTKKEKGISLRDSIDGIQIPEKLKLYEKDLKNCHGLA